MGPMNRLSKNINEIAAQIAEVQSLTSRLRDANRRLTGSTGEAPTQLAGAGGGMVEPKELPLMVSLTTSMERLNSAVADLRAEVTYLENTTSETGAPEDSAKAAYAGR